jgi:transcriptional regulator with XRE-family HTH domain
MPDPGRAIRLRVGRAIRRLRLARGFSQERLAELAGSSGKHVGAIERGQANVGLDALGRIAGALSVDAAVLFAPTRGRLRGGAAVHVIAREDVDRMIATLQSVKAVRAPRRRSSE